MHLSCESPFRGHMHDEATWLRFGPGYIMTLITLIMYNHCTLHTHSHRWIYLRMCMDADLLNISDTQTGCSCHEHSLHVTHTRIPMNISRHVHGYGPVAYLWYSDRMLLRSSSSPSSFKNTWLDPTCARDNSYHNDSYHYDQQQRITTVRTSAGDVTSEHVSSLEMHTRLPVQHWVIRQMSDIYKATHAYVYVHEHIYMWNHLEEWAASANVLSEDRLSNSFRLLLYCCLYIHIYIHVYIIYTYVCANTCMW